MGFVSRSSGAMGVGLRFTVQVIELLGGNFGVLGILGIV